MNNDIKTLQAEILSANIDFLRMNHIRVSPDKIYTIGFKETKRDGKSDFVPCLVDAKNNKFEASVYQLAAMRILKGSANSEWSGDFRHNPDGHQLQNLIPDLVASGVTLETIKFKCVKNLKIQNFLAKNSDTPVYRDICYSGYSTYREQLYKLYEEYKSAAERQTQEYRTKRDAIVAALRSSELVPSKKIDENLELIPVFEILA